MNTDGPFVGIEMADGSPIWVNRPHVASIRDCKDKWAIDQFSGDLSVINLSHGESWIVRGKPDDVVQLLFRDVLHRRVNIT